MAVHFLDTETRPELPLTALRCVTAGLSVAEVREIWRYEVARALAFNLWDLTGVWAAWDRAWLVARIVRHRGRWAAAPGRRPGFARWLRYRLVAGRVDGDARSLGRFVRYLGAIEDEAHRRQTAAALAAIARIAFDFCADDDREAPGEALALRRSLVPEPYSTLIAPALLPEETRGCRARILGAYGAATT